MWGFLGRSGTPKIDRTVDAESASPVNRLTRRYTVHYTFNGETFHETIRAYDFYDADARCKFLGYTLDGMIPG